MVKAKLVSLNNYGATLPMALMTSNRSIHQPSESLTSGDYNLFTVDDNDCLTLYKIKSYLMSPLSNTIRNFKMAKKMDILLEYPVQTIEWIAQESKSNQFSTNNFGMTNQDAHRRSRHLLMPNFLITYVDQAFIDYFDEKGSLLHRVDLGAIFEAYEDLEMVKLEQIKIPKLAWSCRSLNTLPK